MESANTTLVLFLFLLLPFLDPATAAAGCYSSIFSFGDSLADTGNLLHFSGGNFENSRPPYGMTFFHHPTGRSSDGRLMVDFIAEAMELPLLPPSMEVMGGSTMGAEELRKGVNFAVGGATAMEYEFFKERGISVRDNNSSLFFQLRWFKQLLPSLCSSPADCKKMLKSSLFLMGEIGGNDYNNPLRQMIPLTQIKSFVPRVVQTISSAIKELIEMGAETLVVPGITPLGCNPVYLTMFHNNTSAAAEEYYDSTGCIKWLNQFCIYHNDILHNEVRRLQKLHPHVRLIYADYYGTMKNIFDNPDQFGFGQREVFLTCCGGGGPFNFNPSATCGAEGFTVCEDPSKYFHWDGMHCTEAAYGVIAKSLLKSLFPTPAILNSCAGIELDAEFPSNRSSS